MGAENSILNQCQWGEKFTLSSSSDWSLQQATTQNDLDVTVFQHNKKDRKQIDLLKKAAKHLKMLRHPAILRYIGSGESSEGSYLITEEVLPLENVIKNLTSLEICAGIYEILEALVFLHDKVGITHNNICISSVYVVKDGSWKLSGLEHCCHFEEATIQFLEKCRAFRNEDSISPEEKAGKCDNTRDCGHVRDVYSFGVLVDQLIENLDELGDVASSFEKRIHSECLNIEASQRPKLNTILKDRFFKNDSIDIIKFLRNITVKEENERKEFFSSLTSKLLALPETLVARRLKDLLLSRFVLMDDQANKFLITHLLTPSKNNERSVMVKAGKVTPIFSRDVFKRCIIPLITKIFCIREKHIRLVLLHHFSSYVSTFDPDILQDDIFPHLLLGLRDSDDKIVAASLRALADIVPILGGNIVIGGTRKQFFTHGLPKFNGKIIVEELKVDGLIGKKILLKDLAGIGQKPSPEEEKWKKMAEREKRKEALATKREEKKKLKTLDGEQRKESQMPVNPTVMDERPIMDERTVMDDRTVLDESLHQLNGQNSLYKNIEIIVEEDRADDWSDLEDIDRNDLDLEKHNPDGLNISKSDSESVVSENAISDEIESQLITMPTTISSKTLQNKTTDSEFISKTNSKNSRLKKLPLQLKKNKVVGESKKKVESSSGVNKTSHSSYFDKDWGVDLDSSLPTDHVTESDQSRTINAQRSSTSTDSNRSVPKMSVNLGEEFDIKSINVKSKSRDSFDFFADMTPDIKPVNKLTSFLDSISGSHTPTLQEDSNSHSISAQKIVKPDLSSLHVERTETKTSINKFYMTASSSIIDEVNTEGDGWDEGDWGNDFN